MALAIATVGGVGLAPVASGTFGSAAGVGLYLLLAGLGPWLYLLTTLALLSVGIWAAEEAERELAVQEAAIPDRDHRLIGRQEISVQIYEHVFPPTRRGRGVGIRKRLPHGLGSESHTLWVEATGQSGCFFI